MKNLHVLLSFGLERLFYALVEGDTILSGRRLQTFNFYLYLSIRPYQIGVLYLWEHSIEKKPQQGYLVFVVSETAVPFHYLSLKIMLK